jgi:hypothetical protein
MKRLSVTTLLGLLCMSWAPAHAAPARASASAEPPVLRAVRSARQPGFDRLVFEFDSARLPKWEATLIERPVLDCGSGEPVAVAGRALLQIRFSGAQAHSAQGRSTSGPRRRKLPLKIGRELVRSCDFEGEVTWVVGLASRQAFTARTLGSPARLVIDLSHAKRAP